MPLYQFVSAFTVATIDFFQRHHLIPTEVANSSPLIQELAALGLYTNSTHNNFATNGQHLPTDLETAIASGFALHNGPHQAYSEFVIKVLNDIRIETLQKVDALTGQGLTPAEAKAIAYCEALTNIQKFQVYLKVGLVGRFTQVVDGDGAVRTHVQPKLLVSATDPRREGGAAPGDQDPLRSDYSQITWAEVKAHPAFITPGFVDALNSKPGITDPFWTNELGERLDYAQRAALFTDPVFADFLARRAQTLSLAEISAYGKLLHTADSRLTRFSIGVGIGGVIAYMGNEVYNNGETFQGAIEKWMDSVTIEDVTNTAIGFAAGAAVTYGVAMMFGPIGVGVLLTLEVVSNIDEVQKVMGELGEAFQNAPWVQEIEQGFTQLQSDIELAFNNLVDYAEAEFYEFLTSQFRFAGYGLTTHGGADSDWMVHQNYGGIDGREGNDFLFALSSMANAPLEVEDPSLRILGGSGDDVIVAINQQEVGDGQTLAQESKELYIDAGVGNDTVFSLGAAEIYLGAGDDWLIQAGNGSVVHGGEGNDTFWYSDGIMIADANGADTFSYYGLDLSLALAWGGAESQWATFASLPLVWAGFNADGDLVVQDFISLIRSFWDDPANGALYNMYFANGNRDPNAAPADLTAGIKVAATEFEAKRLMDVEGSAVAGQFQILELLADNLNETMRDKCLTPGVDPLVLDLDGDGLELMARSSVAPLFDVDGDMFAERTGWVMRDDGLLAVDANANGKIDDVAELFGSQTASGFLELATYDSNADGKVDASDAKFADLRIWQDKDGDAVTDAGELLTLAQAKIVSIATGSTPLSGTKNALNTVAAQGSFTREDSTTGGIYDVRFLTNDFKSQYIGDTSVSAAVAANQPNLKGRGTLMDLHVALSHDPTIGLTGTPDGALAVMIAAELPQMNSLVIRDPEDNTGTLSDHAEKIMVSWGKTAELVALSPDEQLTLYEWNPLKSAEDVAGHAIRVTDATGTHWERHIYVWNSEHTEVLSETIVSYDSLADLLEDGTPPNSRYGTSQIRNDGVKIIVETDENGEETIVNFGHRTSIVVDVLDHEEVTTTHEVTVYLTHFATNQVILESAHGALEHAAINQYLSVHGLTKIVSLPSDREVRDFAPSREYLLEHYLGIDIPFENPGLYIPAMLPTVTEALNRMDTAIDLMAVRLAMQGPLEPFFAGVRYDVAADAFKPTTNRQLVPMFEALFTEALANHSGGIAGWFEEWEDVMRVFLGGYQRGGSQKNTYPFLYTTIIAAYENIVAPAFPSSTPPVGLFEAAIAFGVPEDQIRTSSGLMTGTNDIDLFYLGAGNDTAKGGTGEDSYIVGKDFGQDVIDDYEGTPAAHDFDTLRFAHLNPGDITATRDGLDLLITVNGKSDTLRLINQFYEIVPFLEGGNTQPEQGVDEIVFADGTVWGHQNIAFAVSHPLATDENLVGTDHVDVLDGGAGKDTLSGGDNADIYIFGKGYGQDLIQEKMKFITNVQTDLLIFKDGIAEDDVSFYRDGSSYDLQIKIDGTDDVLVIEKQFDSTYAGPFDQQWLNRVEEFNFADKNTLSHRDIARKIIKQHQTDGNDTIYGFDYEDRIDGGKGDDSLVGGNENDVYVFGKGYGHDRIREVISAVDVNLLSGQTDRVEFGTGIGTADVTLSRDGGSNDLKISLTDGSTLTVENQFFRNTLGHKMDWIEEFKFSDGTVWTADQVQEMLIQQGKTDGNDKIYGYFRADTLDGGAGNDTLIGGGDSDSYIWGIGSGLDVVEDFEPDESFVGKDKIILGEGITAANIRLWRSGNTLHIGVIDQNDRLSIKNQFATAGAGLRLSEVEELRFADGTVWTRSDIQTYLLGGTEGNDLLIGFSGADVLDGGKGDDTLQGQGGGDAYIFRQGDGKDVIEDVWGHPFQNKTDYIEFGDGILASNIVLTRAANLLDLTIGFNGATDQITIVDQFENVAMPLSEIEEFRFADGTVWARDEIRQFLLQSTNGNDSLIGFFDADTLAGGLGNDTLKGAAGADTYIFNAGDGQDVIDEGLSGSEGDKLVFGNGLLASDIQFTRSGKDLTVGFAGLTDKVTIVDYYVAPIADRPSEIEEFHFADSTIWHRADIEALMLAGTDGNDSLVGASGSQTLEGGLGDDTLKGGSGSDTYVFDVGHGNDLIAENPSEVTTNNIDVVTFRPGIAVGDLRLSKSGNTAIIENVITGDRLTIQDHFDVSATDWTIEEFRFADSTVWSSATFAAFYKQGTSGANSLSGTAAADYLNGLAGADTLTGGQGHDTYVVDNTGDKVVEAASEGIDTIETSITLTLAANVENLVLLGSAAIGGTGNDLANVITGNAGNNTLDGGVGGTDTLTGGAGNDTYLVAATDDVIVELAGEGTDAVSSSVDYSLSGQVENLTLTGSAISGTGSNLANTIAGNASANSLSGAEGDDTLDGASGADTLAGGTGNDTYVYDGTDLIVEAADEGADTIQYGATFDLNTIANIENLTLTGTGAFSGTGTAADNLIAGNSSANSLTGGDGNDTLNGGAGADTLDGGAGDDTYVIDSSSDKISEAAGAGTDTVQSSLIYTLLAEFENLTLTGSSLINGTGNAANNVITGNSNANSLDGGAGIDTLIGGKGNDTYAVDSDTDAIVEAADEGTDLVKSSVTLDLTGIANVENLTLTGSISIDGTGNEQNNDITGNSGANKLAGGDGSDTLDGAGGADTMTGGIGDDRYYVNNAGDIVVEATGEGIDEVIVSISYTLGEALENLSMTISASNNNATGNGLDNAISGNVGKNVLTGNAGNDSLSGSDGADTMIGGVGDDFYTIENAGDVVIELLDEGIDTVIAHGLTYTLGDYFENLQLSANSNTNGIGNATDNRIEGNSKANQLEGLNGNDSLLGATGNDTLIGGIGSDTLFGEGFADSLIGGDGADFLDGGSELDADTMAGGTGDDTYVIDSASDAVTELAGEGTDTVQSTIAYTLGSELENLQLLGSSNIAGTGNALNNSLVGNTGKNSLVGGDGDDTLDGGTGIDTLTGGAGSDLYLHGRGAGGDTIANNDSAGTDVLRFGSDVDAYQLWFAQSGNDLKISIIGTDDVATIQGWYAGASNQLDEFRTTDGNMVLDYSEVQQLVDAMATFTPPPSGEFTLSQDVKDALTPTISATWQSAA